MRAAMGRCITSFAWSRQRAACLPAAWARPLGARAGGRPAPLPPPAAAGAGSAAVPGAVPWAAAATTSAPQSELVTRTLLGSAGALCCAGLPPGAVAAFASATGPSAGAGAAQEPTCVRCRIEPLGGGAADALSDVLLSLGAQSVVVEEYREPGAPEQEVFGAESGLWDTCSVVAHFGLEHDVDETLRVAAEVLEEVLSAEEGEAPDGAAPDGAAPNGAAPDGAAPDDGPAPSGGAAAAAGVQGGGGVGGPAGARWRYTLEPVANTEWVEQIKASYVPLRINDGLYIVPSWSQPEDPSALNIILEPGVAFGTGEHPTTRLCLGHLWALKDELRGARVVDYGSGSGVLAIAALLLGAERAAGTDTDPLAVKAAARNAALNGVEGRFDSLQCSPDLAGPEPLAEAGLPSEASYELVVANILRGPLVELAPRLGAYVRPGGRLALSGLLAEQVPDVRAAYEAMFENFEVATDGSWALVTARRRLEE